MKRILLVGEHPYGQGGNNNMLRALVEGLDREKFIPAVFAVSHADIPAYEPPDYSISTPAGDPNDPRGIKILFNLIFRENFDGVLLVGLDIWELSPIWSYLLQLKRQKKFSLGAIFPYDQHHLRHDWLPWIKGLDYPCVYSQFGYDLLKDAVPHVLYFRPPMYGSDQFRMLSPEERKSAREKNFPTVSEDQKIVGFFGRNQFRKDPQKVIRAVFDAKKNLPQLVLYMHTDLANGPYNLVQYMLDCGAASGDVISKHQQSRHTIDRMVEIYNSIDVYVNASYQEGLSWTVLEAMLCGVPVVASNNTAHIELLEGGAGYPVETRQLCYLPVAGSTGQSWVETYCCDYKDLSNAIKTVLITPGTREKLIEKGLARAKEWLAGVSDINELADQMTRKKTTMSIDKVLFVQHSSAGDVLMSTQCFKGIKERHEGKKLVYMTQKLFRDIVEDNPYLDEIVDYDESEIPRYEIVYNPHGDRILTGGFNNLDVKLHSMYPYFCKVEADDQYIKPVEPDVALPDKYVVVHTAGGQPQYRTYKHMAVAMKGLAFPFVQIGGSRDAYCKGAIDLRGKLTWRQTAWVMKNALAAVVVDSFPSHLAGALGTPVVVLYGPAPARVTGPKGDPAKIVNLEPNKLDVCPSLTNCWGNVPGESWCQTPCINTISPLKVRKALKELLVKFNKEGGDN